MRTNVKTSPITGHTHGGADAVNTSAIESLRRTVLANMLWESEFYEDGKSSAERIKTLVKSVGFDAAAKIAVEAREKMKLRHVPLLLTRELIRNHGGRKVGDLIYNVIQRPDEMAELLALYWKDGKDQPLTAQMKIGLARAFKKFQEYELAKWDKDGDVRLRDVLFQAHVRPFGANERVPYTRKERKHAEKYKLNGHEELLKRVAEGKLATPDTWEVALSGGATKKETFERLISERKLGGLAMLRNLRNMIQGGVSHDLIRQGLAQMKTDRILPFRFIAAAQHAPQFEAEIDAAMMRSLAQTQKLPGKTVVVVDVSGSMYGGTVSAKSEMNRARAAAALGAVCREVCEIPAVYATAGNDGTRKHKTELVPARRGMALVDAIYALSRPLGGGGIFLNQCMRYIKEREGTAARTIVITDEQDCDLARMSAQTAQPLGQGYLINVASYQNGIGYRGNWVHITGFSEAIIDYIREYENAEG